MGPWVPRHLGALDRPVSQFFQISSFRSSSWVRGWHVELWTSMGKFYTVRYSGRGYGKGNMGKTIGYYDFGKVEEYTVT